MITLVKTHHFQVATVLAQALEVDLEEVVVQVGSNHNLKQQYGDIINIDRMKKVEQMLKTLIFRDFRYNEDIEEKIRSLEDKLSVDKDNVEYLKELAGIYHAYKKNSKAIEIYEKLSELKPNDLVRFLAFLEVSIL